MTEIKLPPLPDWFNGYSEADKHVVQRYTAAAIEAALQSQDREDAERLDWLAEQEAQIQILALANGIRYRLGWPDDGEAQSEWFKCPREAIDHARRIEGD